MYHIWHINCIKKENLVTKLINTNDVKNQRKRLPDAYVSSLVGWWIKGYFGHIGILDYLTSIFIVLTTLSSLKLILFCGQIIFSPTKLATCTYISIYQSDCYLYRDWLRKFATTSGPFCAYLGSFTYIMRYIKLVRLRPIFYHIAGLCSLLTWFMRCSKKSKNVS